MDKAVFANYQTGIVDIDAEHLEILELIEKISDAAKIRAWGLAITYITELQRLKDEHFSNEEHLMEKIHFPYLGHHRINHARILAELEKFIIQFQASGHGFTSERLVRLVLNHIDHYDRQYIAFYNAWLAAQKNSAAIQPV